MPKPAKAPRAKPRAYPWYEGIPLCPTCWTQHRQPECPVFDPHVGPCPCSFGDPQRWRPSLRLTCPSGPHERYYVARSIAAMVRDPGNDQ